MNTCPFWSNNKEKVACNKECPMHPAINKGDDCAFQDCLESNINYKDIIEDFAYAEDKYSGYTFKKEMTNY